MLDGGFLLRIASVRRRVGQLGSIVGSTKPHGSEKFIQHFLPAQKSLLFVLDVAPTRRYDARRIGNFVGTEAFGVSTTRSEKVASALYQLIYMKMRSHGALECAPFGYYPFADDNRKVLARRPLN